MTLLRLTALVAVLAMATAEPTRLNRRHLQETKSDSTDEDHFFCECECDGDGTAAIWIGDTNPDFKPDTEDQGEDEEGHKYSWACETDAKVFDYLYDTTDVFCANECLDGDEEIEDEEGDEVEFVETDDEFYQEREEDGDE